MAASVRRYTDGMTLGAQTVVPAITASQLGALARRTAGEAGAPVVVDLRAPVEFAEDHVPGAHSVPLFDDARRALIGTLYTRVSPEAAFAEGVEATVERVGSLVLEIAHLGPGTPPPLADLEARVREMCAHGIAGLEGELVTEPAEVLPQDPIVVHCWRGGLRSRSVAALLRALGMRNVIVLEGGYKAYRRHVIERLDAWVAPSTFVLRGLTGVGKTLVLRAIEALRPGSTLDLEGLAGHRSSILGMVGLEPCTQKTFDSRLLARFERGFGPWMVVEGESRKVGDVILHPNLWRAMGSSTGIELVASTARRVRVLVEDYLARPENREPLAEQLRFLESRLGKRFEGELVRMLEEGREDELVPLLLEHYYDPLYRHSGGRYRLDVSFDTEDPAACAQEIVAWIEARSSTAAAQDAAASPPAN